MSPEEYGQVVAFFERAKNVPEGERDSWLDQKCESEVVRTEVRRWLATDTSAFRELKPIASASQIWQDAAAHSTRVPEIVGFSVIDCIAQGASGVVYRAQQHAPSRRVAIKVLRASATSVGEFERFVREGQTLASLDHPNIATVHAVGRTSDGQPYIAMELIEGDHITSYVKLHKLDVAGRLRLIDQLCAAIQHAHERLIIHRDLKPANVLVLGPPDAPSVRVIDFGIGRELGAGATMTMVGQALGTPDYMSPEQAALEPVADTRSDVYTLGVLLFELLTGALPHGRCTGGASTTRAVMVAIASRDPVRPSDRVQSGVVSPSVDPLPPRQLRGDLDAIALKALQRKATDRYASAGDLRQDVRRYLDRRPVAARKLSAFYELRRFARRHGAVSALVAVLGAVLLGAFVLVLNARQEAIASASRAEAAAARSSMSLASVAAGELRFGVAMDALEDVPEALRGFQWHMLCAYLQGNAAMQSFAPPIAVGLQQFGDGVLVGDGRRTVQFARPGASPIPIFETIGRIIAVAGDAVGGWVCALDDRGELRIHELETGEQCIATLIPSPVAAMLAVDQERLIARTRFEIVCMRMPNLEVDWRRPDVVTNTPSELPLVVLDDKVWTIDDAKRLICIDMSSGQELAIDDTGPVQALTTAPDGQCVVVLRERGDLMEVSVEGEMGWQELIDADNELPPCQSLVITGTDGVLALGSREPILFEWPNGSAVGPLCSDLGGATVACGDAWLWVSNRQGQLHWWRVDDAEVLGRGARYFGTDDALLRAELGIDAPMPEGAHHLDWSPDKETIIAFAPGYLYFWRDGAWEPAPVAPVGYDPAIAARTGEVLVATGEKLVVIASHGETVIDPQDWQCGQAVISNDGTTLAVPVRGYKLQVCDIATGKEVASTNSRGTVTCAEVALDGLVYWGTTDGSVYRWQYLTDESPALIGKGPENLAELFIVDAGRTLAAFAAYGALACWDLTTERLSPTITPALGRGKRIHLSPDERVLTVFSGNYVVQLGASGATTPSAN
ncbi:MAG: serine/threonine protein kinase [Phycisphaerales bacterium]|nr:serine/threonine protein kinase [Phycisphaerales bacterium]